MRQRRRGLGYADGRRSQSRRKSALTAFPSRYAIAISHRRRRTLAEGRRDAVWMGMLYAGSNDLSADAVIGLADVFAVWLSPVLSA